MAFPTIPTVAAGRLLSANIDGTGTRTFPSLTGLTKNSGDLLIAIIVAYQSSSGAGAPGGSVFSSWGGSFTEFCDQMTTNSSTMAIGAAYKISDGTETGTFTVTQAATITGGASLFLLSIPGAHASTVPEVGTIANGTAAAADPGSFNPANWATEDTLWVSVVCSGMTSGTSTWTATGTTAPTNYGNRVDTNRADDSTIGRVEGAVAFRQLNAASEDVGTAGVDVSNARNSALVIAVRPAAVVTETPTPGGGTAGGNALTALASVVIAGALAAGPAPAVLTAVTTGGALAQGVEATARVDVTPGGALADGIPPIAPVFETPVPGGALAQGLGATARTDLASSGALAQGVAVPLALIALEPGGALAGGTAPLATVYETVAPGGALAQGTTQGAAAGVGAGGGAAAGAAPTTAVVALGPGGALAGGVAPAESLVETLTIGGALAGGVAPSPLVSLSSGGATAGGVAPVEGLTETPAPGGALADGIALPGALIALEVGGATAGGFPPTDGAAQEETPIPGGALAGGFGLAIGASSSAGGAASGGMPIPGAVVPLSTGGALAGGFPPIVAQLEFDLPDTGYIVFPDQGISPIALDGSVLIVTTKRGIVRLAAPGNLAKSVAGRVTS